LSLRPLIYMMFSADADMTVTTYPVIKLIGGGDFALDKEYET